MGATPLQLGLVDLWGNLQACEPQVYTGAFEVAFRFLPITRPAAHGP